MKSVSQLTTFSIQYYPISTINCVHLYTCKIVLVAPKLVWIPESENPNQKPDTQLQSNSQKLQRWICLGRVVLLPYMLLHNV